MEFIRVQVYSFKSTITRINPLIQWIPLLTSQSGTALFLKKSDAWIKASLWFSWRKNLHLF